MNFKLKIIHSYEYYINNILGYSYQELLNEFQNPKTLDKNIV